MNQVERSPILPTQISPGPNDQFLSAFLKAITETLQRFANRINAVLPKDGSEPMTGPLELKEYTVATLPAASSYEGSVIYVSDGAAGQKFRGSDGTSWAFLG